ncbi:MAG: hypothetical protein AB7N91_04980 [Candidatus Tectimicrobiota bacterium]
MQANTALWITPTSLSLSNPVQPRELHSSVGGAVQRCQRCDILLGSYRCPNPACQEMHGEGSEHLCAWCLDNDREPLEAGDWTAWITETLQWP